jgi:hypothetical protein
MRSPAVRVTVGLLAWIALGLAAFFLIRTQQEISRLAASVRAFDLRARETADALAEMRAGQRAYVAAGQGADFWMPKVAATTSAVRNQMVALRQSASSGPARASLMDAEAVVAEFDALDKRARDYLKSGETLMAADVIFTEGGETAANAARHVEQARLADHQAFDARDAEFRAQQATALGGAAGIAGLIVLLLAFVPRPRAAAAAESSIDGSVEPAPAAPRAAVLSLRPHAPPLLKTAAELCTDFGRVRDVSDLKDLLARAAQAMDASGLIVWLGSTSGADLQPIVSHGYSTQVIAHMPSVPKSADNAAAAAYRNGTLQIVLSRPGGSPGALVAPLLVSEGCVGAFSAEVRSNTEGSETVQALAVIFAAQLAGIFAVAASDSSDQKTAVQG